MGYDEADASSTIEKTFNEDMERFGGTFEESSLRYRILLENISRRTANSRQSEVDAKQQVKDFKRRLDATEAEKNAQIDIYKKDLQKVQEDAASERNKFQAKSTDESARKIDKIASQLAEQRNRYDDMVASRTLPPRWRS